MTPLRLIWMVLAVPLLCAQTADVHSVIAASRQRIEKSDFSASGHLVWVQPSGTRISYPITIKAHWFPGVLRILAELSNAPKTGPNALVFARMQIHALFELRPSGQSSIWIAHPGDKSPVALPFEKWSDGPIGSAFSYEDFLEDQLFWPGQTIVDETNLGTRDCDVVKSTPAQDDKTQYSEVKTWFDRSIAYPIYVEKTVKNTGVVKEFTAYGLRKEGDSWAAHQIEMKARGQAGSTLLVLDRGTAKAHLALSDFSLAQLTHF
jgi:hypothetical protein